MMLNIFGKSTATSEDSAGILARESLLEQYRVYTMQGVAGI